MKNKGFLIRVAISICLVAFLLRMVDLSALVHTLKGTRLSFSVIVILLAICDRVFMAVKWRVLLHAIGIRITLFESIRTYFASSFMGMFLPTSVGSDILRLFIVGVDKRQREGIAASIVVERLVAFIALILLVAVVAAVALFYFSFHRIGAIIALALVVLVLSLWGFAFSLYQFPVSMLDRFKGKFGDLLRRLLLSYQTYRDKKSALVIFFILSFLEHLFPIVCNYFTSRALGIKMNPLAFFIVIPIILIFARLPISLDGIGILEGLYWALFQMAGMSQADALSMGLLARFLTTLALLPGGIFFMLHPGRRELKNGNKN